MQKVRRHLRNPDILWMVPHNWNKIRKVNIQQCTKMGGGGTQNTYVFFIFIKSITSRKFKFYHKTIFKNLIYLTVSMLKGHSCNLVCISIKLRDSHRRDSQTHKECPKSKQQRATFHCLVCFKKVYFQVNLVGLSITTLKVSPISAENL